MNLQVSNTLLLWLTSFAIFNLSDANPSENFLHLTAVFSESQVLGIAGEDTALTITLENTGVTTTFNDLSFSVDLVGLGVPFIFDIVAGGSTSCNNGLTEIVNPDVARFVSGTLAPASTCTITFLLLVSTSPTAGTYQISTSEISVNINNSPLSFPKATFANPLTVAAVTSGVGYFVPAVVSDLLTEITTLTLELTNPDTTFPFLLSFLTLNFAASNIPFNAIGAQTTNTCGSTVSGTSFLVIIGGSVPPGGTCSYSIVLGAVPSSADRKGSFQGVTSSISGSLNSVNQALPAITTSALVVLESTSQAEVPTLSQYFSPNKMPPGSNTRIHFAIDNTANTSPAQEISFTQALPTGLLFASFLSIESTCSGFQNALAADRSSITFSGGSAIGDSTCTISVLVDSADTEATYSVDPITLTSSYGASDASNSASLDITNTRNSPPTITYSYSPSSFEQGSTSVMSFYIQNPDGLAIPDAEVAVALPSGVVVAASPNIRSTCCGFRTDANIGSSSFILWQKMPASSACTLFIDVTSTTQGSFADLVTFTWDAGQNTATISSPVTVTNDSVTTVSMDFSPSVTSYGSISTLTYTIDNTFNSAGSGCISWSQDWPSGIEVMGEATTTCPTALDYSSNCISILDIDTSAFAVSNANLLAGVSCTIQVPVRINYQGVLTASTGNISLNRFFTPFIPALYNSLQATLEGTASDLIVTKEFTNQVLPGQQVQVEYTIFFPNNGDETASGLAFTEDFANSSPSISGISVSNVSGSCGDGSTFTMSSTTVTLSGGSLSAGESCVLVATIDVPSNIAPASYSFQGPGISGNVGGTVVTSGTTTDDLVVTLAPVLTTQWLDSSPVYPGDTVVLQVTVNNPTAEDYTNVAWVSNYALSDKLGFTFSATFPTAPCGSGSSVGFGFGSFVDTKGLLLSNVQILAGENCTFEIPITVPSLINPSTFTFPRVDGLGDIGKVTVTAAGNSYSSETDWDDLIISLQAPPYVQARLLSGADCADANGSSVVVEAISSVSADQVTWTGPFDEGTGTAYGLRPGVLTLPVGTSMLSVVATDSSLTSEDFLEVTVVENDPPVANAGTSQYFYEVAQASTSVEITLDGSQSFDPEGSVLRYFWSINGAEFEGDDVVVTNLPSPDENQIKLTVTDECGNSSSDSIVVSFSTLTDSPSLQPSAVPSAQPSLSSSPSSMPSLTPSLMPSTAPSLSTQPSLVPSLSTKPSSMPSLSTQPSSVPSLSTQPSSMPSSDSCSRKPENACGYSRNSDGSIKMSSYIVCTFDPNKRKYKSGCLRVDEFPDIAEGFVWDKNEVVDSCGCCSAAIEKKSPGFCSTDIPCDIEENYCGADKDGDVKIRYCTAKKSKKGQKLKTKCGDPFKAGKSSKKDSFYSCGYCSS